MLLGIEWYNIVAECCRFWALSFWRDTKASEYAFKEPVCVKAVGFFDKYKKKTFTFRKHEKELQGFIW